VLYIANCPCNIIGSAIATDAASKYAIDWPAKGLTSKETGEHVGSFDDMPFMHCVYMTTRLRTIVSTGAYLVI
jgi:hypothetical protein